MRGRGYKKHHVGEAFPKVIWRRNCPFLFQDFSCSSHKLAIGMMLLTSDSWTFCNRVSMLQVVFWVISQISEVTFVTWRSLQFSGLLMFSFHSSKAGSFRPDAKRLSTSDNAVSRGGPVSGSVSSLSVAFSSPSPSEELNNFSSSSCAAS